MCSVAGIPLRAFYVSNCFLPLLVIIDSNYFVFDFAITFILNVDAANYLVSDVEK